jgi:hypothetical protein
MKRTILAASITLACGAAYAQDTTVDPRSLAMGGVGIATSNPGNAIFHNAAMLASTKDKSQDDFAWEFPIIGVRLLDEDKMASNLLPDMNTNATALSDAAKSFSNALTAFNGAQNAGTLQTLQNSAKTAGSALTKFNSSMSAVSQKAMMGNALVGTALAIPSKKYAFALFVDARVELGAKFVYAASDQTTVGALATSLTACGNATPADTSSCTNANNNFGTDGKVTGLKSDLQVRGVTAKEIGIATAKYFDVLDGLDIGIVPKLAQYATYDYSVQAQNDAKITLDQGKVGYSVFNIDVGALQSYNTKNGDVIKAGVAVKDLMSKSMTTVLGNKIEIKPRATVGVSYMTKLTTLGADLDLIKNSPMLVGFGKESQFLRLGAEFDAWNWMQFRIGYRHDLKGNYSGLPSVGFGLSPFGLHFDLSAAYANKKEAALSLQTGFRF